MSEAHLLSNLFPAMQDIPQQWLPGEPQVQKEYLVDGRFEQWEGPLAKVMSPLCLATSEGDRPVELGSTPRLDAKAAMTALDAAVRAYDKGRGAWPMMRSRSGYGMWRLSWSACVNSGRQWSSC